MNAVRAWSTTNWMTEAIKEEESMSVITKNGDEGDTWLGGWVAKSSPAIEIVGDLDELNAWIGVLAEIQFVARLDGDLARLQDRIMRAGAAIYKERRWPAGTQEAVWLEERVHEMEAELPVLRNFILPRFPAEFHVARAVCRRVERRADEYNRSSDPVDHGLLVFLNRLSDYLFTAARWACQTRNRKETIWRGI